MWLPDIEMGLAPLLGQPWLVFLGILLLTWLLEDATAVAAGALAMAGRVDPPLALAALLLGTVSGDLLLHGAGRLARRSPMVARLAARHCRLGQAGRSVAAVAAARFVPGLRLPAYVGSGVAGLPLAQFLLVVSLSALAWTPLLFLGGSALTESGAVPWLAGGAIVALLLAPRLYRGRREAAPACP